MSRQNSCIYSVPICGIIYIYFSFAEMHVAFRLHVEPDKINELWTKSTAIKVFGELSRFV